MEFAEQIVELRLRGYICVQPLTKIMYTNGVTYYFKKGQYFTCYDENDPEWKSVIFNSDLKKLGYMYSDKVNLRIEKATATISSSCADPSVWCVETAKSNTVNMFTQLNMIKVRAALDAAGSGIEVAEYCGVVPVFKDPAPSSEISCWAVETKKMRDIFIASNEAEIKSFVEKWELMKYLDTNGKLIALDKYEMRNTDGAIRRVDDIKKRHVEGVVPLLRVTIEGKTTPKSFERHRVYMSTFKMHERRTHQDFVDHIDGDDSYNVPWNYRWVSRVENELAKHSKMARRVVPDIDALTAMYGEPSDPVVWNGWTFHRNMWIIRPNEPYEKRFVKRIVSGGDYPSIKVALKDIKGVPMKSRHILCHMIVAYLDRANLPISKGTRKYMKSADLSKSYFATSPMTDLEFADALKKCGLVIMHSDDDKSNYSFDNLEIGTISENQLGRQDNPATTLRKRVKIIDVVSKKCIWIFGSHNEAAAFLGVTKPAVSNSTRFNGTREMATYRKTTSKKTGMKYYVVDAAA